jgi:hypothetical protein
LILSTHPPWKTISESVVKSPKLGWLKMALYSNQSWLLPSFGLSIKAAAYAIFGSTLVT